MLKDPAAPLSVITKLKQNVERPAAPLSGPQTSSTTPEHNVERPGGSEWTSKFITKWNKILKDPVDPLSGPPRSSRNRNIKLKDPACESTGLWC